MLDNSSRQKSRKLFPRNVAGETPAVPVKSLRDCRLLLLARIRYQANWAKQSGRECLDLVHVLRLESFSVTKIEQTIIRETVAGHVVHRSVGDLDSDLIRTRFEEGADIQRVRRTPNCTRAFVIYIYDCCLTHWSFEPRLHPIPQRLRC